MALRDWFGVALLAVCLAIAVEFYERLCRHRALLRLHRARQVPGDKGPSQPS